MQGFLIFCTGVKKKPGTNRETNFETGWKKPVIGFGSGFWHPVLIG
jgi:hypothetical protein